MKKSKRVFAMLMALCLVFSLAACGNSGESSASGTSGTDASATDGSESGDAASKDVKTLSIFINHSWYAVEKFEGIIPEAITEATGIVLDPTIAVDQNQLGVMIASGEMPDLVYTQDLIDRMSDGTVSYAYDDLISEYNVDWDIPTKQQAIAKGYSKDGKIYTVLNHYSEKSDWKDSNAVPMVGTITYRKDIYEAIGSPEVKNFDDMFNMMGKAKEAYPDVVPLKLNQNWNIDSLRDYAGLGQLEYLKQDDGTYTHYTRDSRYKDILLWLNKCYLNGYVVPDDPFFVKGSTAIADDKYFLGCNCTQNGLPTYNATLAGIDPSFVAAELVPFEDSFFGISNLGWSGTFITKSNKDPEASIKFIQWMFTPEAQALTQMGREGTEYTLNENGLPQFSDKWIAASNAGTLNTDYNPWFYLGGSETVEAESRCAVLDPALVADADAVVRSHFDNYPWVMAARPIGDSDEKVKEDKVTEIRKTYEQKIILAESAEQAAKLYDEYIKIADQTGLKDVEAFVSKKVEEVMPLYQ